MRASSFGITCMAALGAATLTIGAATPAEGQVLRGEQYQHETHWDQQFMDDHPLRPQPHWEDQRWRQQQWQWRGDQWQQPHWQDQRWQGEQWRDERVTPHWQDRHWVEQPWGVRTHPDRRWRDDQWGEQREDTWQQQRWRDDWDRDWRWQQRGFDHHTHPHGMVPRDPRLRYEDQAWRRDFYHQPGIDRRYPQWDQRRFGGNPLGNSPGPNGRNAGGASHDQPQFQPFHLQGTILNLRQVEFIGEPNEHVVADLRTHDGRVHRVVLGTPHEVRRMNIQRGHRIALAATPARIDGVPALYAEDLRFQRAQADSYAYFYDNGEEYNDTQFAEDMTPGTRTIDMTAYDMRFEPDRITARPGQVIRVRLINDCEVPHNIVFDLEDRDVGLRRNLRVAESGTIIFTAPRQPGRYTFYCPVGDHHQQGMEGVLIVQGEARQRR